MFGLVFKVVGIMVAGDGRREAFCDGESALKAALGENCGSDTAWTGWMEAWCAKESLRSYTECSVWGPLMG